MRCALTLTALLALTACASPPQTAVPENLLQPCVRPTVDVQTAGGMAQGLLDYDAALKGCNDDKAAIRQHLSPTQLKEKL